MTDEQIKWLAELTITQGELITALIGAYQHLHERVAPLLPPDEDAVNIAHRFEQLEALAELQPDAAAQARKYFGLPPS